MPLAGQEVLVSYKITLDDGRVAQQCGDGSAELVRIGAGALPLKVEQALTQIGLGEVATVELSAEEAYGVYNPAMVTTLPRAMFANAEAMPVGVYVTLQTPEGPIDALVKAIDEEGVAVDLNGPFAGHAATCEVKLEAYGPESNIEHEKHAPGCACGCDRLKEQLNHD